MSPARDLAVEPPAGRSHAIEMERFALVQRVAGIGVFEWNLRQGRAWWSPQIIELLGRSVEQGPPETLDDALRTVHADDVDKVRVAFDGSADGEDGAVRFRYWVDADLRDAELRYEPLREDGAIVGYRGTMQDVTEPTRHAREADRELSRRASLLDAVDAAVIATDTEGRVTHWNLAAERLYGWSSAEAIGRQTSELTGGADPELAAQILIAVAERGRWEGENDVARKDGSSVPAFVQLATLEDCDGKPEGVVGVSMDISSRVAIENDLRGARDYLEAITANMAEGLLTLDTHGRLTYMNDAGDRLLGWREQGLIGERIVDLVDHLDGSDAVHERLLSNLRPGDAPVKSESNLFISRDHREIEVAYTAAPFESELGEQGTVIVFRDITEQRAAERTARVKLEGLSWIGKIRDALDSGRVVAFAQPIVDLRSGNGAQHELLVRLLDEDGRPVAPSRFLPTAEEFGLILEIDELMVNRAVEAAAAGHKVSVNLSAQSIARRGMVELIDSAIKRVGADPELLTVELTETAMVESEHVALHFVERLAELGFGFSLDDFGTGYGGFMYLKQLPIDYLKIDMEFVRDLAVNEASQRVVRAVVDLARGFGQETIAEGIEDEKTWDILAEMGVDFGQGYLFGRPLPVEEVFAVNAKNEEETLR